MKPAKRGTFFWLALAFKALCVVVTVAAPLASVWLASSLAAYANRATWLPVASALLFFPGLPLAWEGIAALRRSRAKAPKRRFLTFGDRLILRTLAINGLFLVVLLACFPQRAFLALSTRGDWMLDGHHGPTAESVRRGLLGCAGAVEWLYSAASHNPYRDRDVQRDDVQPTPTPTPAPTLKPAPTPAPVAPAKPTLHPVVAAMPREAETSIEAVGKYIAEREPDPKLRVKALHDWVADRVAYDAAGYTAHDVPAGSYDPQAVFASRVGVCAGYAKLMVLLGKASGDEIHYVVGDARSQSAPLEGEGHAWNAAKIDGAWYLIDATWDAGPVSEGKFEKQYSTEYLFTPPEQFIVSHFPDDAKWQLLEEPLSRAEFFRRPVVAPALFSYGLAFRSPDQSQVTVRDGAIDVLLDNPRGAFLLADVQPKQGGERTKCEVSPPAAVRCALPADGSYDLRVYANAQRYGTYEYVGAIQVNARR
ncbi:MAG: hypothetical protein KF837_05935 [Labilithrix sp.]|nr:hypothetical protein [Labilithrix sp.]